MASDEAENPNPINWSHNTSNNSVIDSTYTITPGDISKAPIVSPPLNGKNYYSWSHAMLMAIGVHNKLTFLDGRITRPASTNSNFNA